MARSPSIRINEVFHSIQGESTRAGAPCIFVRLTGCPLRCHYCDTEYAFKEGEPIEVEALKERILAINCTLVEFTGGEPLGQKAVFPLMSELCDAGRTVLVETSNAVDISPCDPRIIRILDLKTPGSGQEARNRMENLDDLRPEDEIKFVIVDRTDYEWAREMIETHDLIARSAAVLMSPTFEQAQGLEILGCKALPPHQLAEWILEDGLDVRMQLQMHKFIWHPQTRGV
ncbi:MAG TPA: 7-carboxy-7-deazaguanine synthase [Phycisphaerales bacterium]|nr:7-carboxy-7-deazaguanine synthase [Phycisphaerales bacterium]